MNASPSRRWTWILLVVVFTLRASAQTTAPAKMPAIVEGRVYAADDKPIVGARVTIYDQGRLPNGDPNLRSDYPLLATGATDNSGQFRIPLAAATAVTVAVQADGFGILLFQSSMDPADEPLTIQMPPAIEVKLQIVDIEGRPQSGVRVSPSSFTRWHDADTFAYWPKQLALELAQVSDGAGMVTFKQMPVNSQIMFGPNDDRFTTSTQTLPRGVETGELPSEPPQVVVEGSSQQSIEGHVYYADTRQPVAGVMVMGNGAVNGRSSYGTSATTDAQGHYKLQHMRPAEVTLIARPSYPLSTHFAGKPSLVTMNPGGATGDTDLLLVPGSIVRGKVTNGDAPVAGIHVTAMAAGANRIMFESIRDGGIPEDITAADGSYAIHVMPGRYSVTARPTEAMNLFPVSNGQNEIDVADGGETEFDIALQPGARESVGLVQGTVVDEQDKPVEGAIVSFLIAPPVRPGNGAIIISGGIPRNTNVVRARTDSAGKFEINVTGPSASVYVQKGPLGLLPKGPSQGREDDLVRYLNGGLPSETIVDAENRQPKIVLKQAAGTAVLHAVDIDGKPVAGAKFAIAASYPWGPLTERWGTAKADGSFTLSPVYPDRKYQVRVSAPGFATLGTGFAQLDGNMKMVVQPGKTADTPPYVMRRTDAIVSGTVVDENGRPAGGAVVVVNGGSRGSVSSRSTRSADDGQFVVDGLVADEDATIVATLPGGARGTPSPIKTGSVDVKLTARRVAAPTPTPARGAARGPATRGR